MSEQVITQKEEVIPVPEVMRQLIQHQSEVLNQHQRELFDKLGLANVELMKIMNLDPTLGWQLDMARLAYVRTIPSDPELPDDHPVVREPGQEY